MLEYKIFDDYIEVIDGDDFNIKHILECGQVFRFKPTEFGYKLYAGEHKADIICQKGTTKIFCKYPKFFENYFDLKKDYAKIKSDLKSDELVKRGIDYGFGIRILKQDPIETIISFIISANNNIPRIKTIIENICLHYGTKINDYYAFPTLNQLSKIPLEFFKEIKCGYRDKYLFETIKMLSKINIDELYKLPTVELKKELLKLKGVGGKVADCILLFGFSRTDVFPTDTWIKKVYVERTGDLKSSANKISEYFVNIFGENSGFAQQYLFYEKMNRK